MPTQEYDEWVKKFPCGKKVRYSYQVLTSGFSASAEIIEPIVSVMVYTHTYSNMRAPANRAQIEAEFAQELTDSVYPEKRSVGT